MLSPEPTTAIGFPMARCAVDQIDIIVMSIHSIRVELYIRMLYIGSHSQVR